MLVVFLDIDGVLVNLASFGLPRLECDGKRHNRPHPDCVAALNRITDKTNARIVVSSVWRFLGMPHMRKVLTASGVTGKVVACTPFLPEHVGEARGFEIKAWLSARESIARLRHNAQIASFVILDDDSDMLDLSPRLIQTNGAIGLTVPDAERAIAILDQEHAA